MSSDLSNFINVASFWNTHRRNQYIDFSKNVHLRPLTVAHTVMQNASLTASAIFDIIVGNNLKKNFMADQITIIECYVILQSDKDNVI